MKCPHTNNNLKNWNFSSNFYIEPNTKTLYNKNWTPLNYEKNYFLEEYKKTYNKTYIEDEKNIRILAKRRLNFLKKFIKKHYSLLEIGCATGFFLDEAKSFFKKLQGIEISTFASEYGRKKFNLKIENINLFDFIQKNQEKFDVIASFYVIEHFKEQKEIFEFISNSLNQGGLWICAIPSTFGPLFQYHTEEWIKFHPLDHFVDYNPKGLKKILKIYKLRLIFFKPASYHQERAKGFLNKIPNQFYKLYSNFFAYGDTIEFIARKDLF